MTLVSLLFIIGIRSFINNVSFILKDFESKFIENDHHKLGIQLWKRYVDDVFAIVKNNEANNILQFLNSKHDSINDDMLYVIMH